MAHNNYLCAPVRDLQSNSVLLHVQTLTGLRAASAMFATRANCGFAPIGGSAMSILPSIMTAACPQGTLGSVTLRQGNDSWYGETLWHSDKDTLCTLHPDGALPSADRRTHFLIARSAPPDAERSRHRQV